MGMGVAAFRIAGACRMALVGFGFALRVVVRPVQAEMSYLHTFTHAHSNFTGLEEFGPQAPVFRFRMLSSSAGLGSCTPSVQEHMDSIRLGVGFKVYMV